MINALNIGAFTPGLYSDPYMLDDLDLMNFSSSAPMMNSIFTGAPGLGMPMPMMGMGYGYDPQQYYDYMRQNQQFSVNYNIDQQKMNRNADMKINASMEGVKGAATALKDKIMKNEQDQIKEAYDKYVAAVAAAYGDGNPAEIQARAKSLYTQMNGGVTLTQDLRKYGHGSFTQGMLQSMTLGTYYKNSAEDNVAYTTNSPVATGEKASQNLGRLTGAGVVGGAAYGAVKGVGALAAKSGSTGGKLAKVVAKAGPIGLITAAGVALLSFIFGSKTSK
jgi:hypothetical protein